MTKISRFLGVFLIGVMIFSGIPAVAESASAKERSSIKLTAPSPESTFAKQGSGIIPISWSVDNAPENTILVLELKHKKLKGGGIGGGTWHHEISAGDSIGTHNWDIEGEGRSSAGTYKLRALLQQCAPKGCNWTVTGKTKVHAKSKWINLTITDKAGNESEEALRAARARPAGPVTVSLATGNEQGQFLYYPGGDVDSCTITGYYQGGKRSLEHGWKNAITPGQYGRFVFDAVEAYPLKSLQSVEVVCGNANYRASDTMRFTVNTSSETGLFKITSGSKTVKKGEGTKEDAIAYCRQVLNDDELHRYRRVQCYWNGEKFEDQSEFKG